MVLLQNERHLKVLKQVLSIDPELYIDHLRVCERLKEHVCQYWEL